MSVRRSQFRHAPCALANALLLVLAPLACTAPEAAGPRLKLRPASPLQLEGERFAVPVAASPCHGPADAPVTVIEFTDFECSHCARSQEQLFALEQRHPGQLRICFKHRTLPLHFFSRDAAEAAEAARLQGKFWEMHDQLFSRQRSLGPDDLVNHARRIGLDLERFQRDRLSEAAFAGVDRDESLAAELGVRSTPTFFFNGRKLKGALPLERFEEFFQLARSDAEAARQTGVPAAGVYDALMRAARQEQGGEQVVGGVPVTAEDPCRGPVDAPVTVIEFTDFECPYCGIAKDTLDALEGKYRGRLRVCIKMNPMPYHAHGKEAALLALAAHRQGRFFELYDDLFAHPGALDRSAALERAAGLGVDLGKLEQDLDSEAVAAMLARHRDEARRAKLRGTPSFIINDEVIFGAKPYAVFEDAVERQLVGR